MSSFKISQQGYDASVAPVQNLLIDSDYPSMLLYSSGTGSQSVAASGTTTLSLPVSYTWLPLGFFYTDNDGNHSTTNKFYLQKNNGGVGAIASGWTPKYNSSTGAYSGWEYIWQGTGSIVTANYMYYITYLQSDGSYNNTDTLTATPPYINISVPGASAQSNRIIDLAFTTLVPFVGIVKEQVITLTGTGNGATLEMSFAHGLGKVLPFTGFITSSTIWGTNTMSFQTANDLKNSAGAYESYDFGIDSTNFYLDINSSNTGTNYSTTIHVYFMQLPT